MKCTHGELRGVISNRLRVRLSLFFRVTDSTAITVGILLS